MIINQYADIGKHVILERPILFVWHRWWKQEADFIVKIKINPSTTPHQVVGPW